MMAGRKGLFILLTAVMALLTASFVTAADGSEGSGVATATADGFKDGKEGTVSFYVTNDEGREITAVFAVYVDVSYGDIESATPYRTEERQLSDGVNNVRISFSLGSGSHTVIVKASSDDTEFTPDYTVISVSVPESIWSSAVTYVTIIVLAVIIVIGVFYYIRSKPKAAPTTTFTELEKEKKKSESAEASPAKGPSTEKRRYGKAEEPAAPAPAPAPAEEKKATSFTELEKEKKKKEKPEAAKKLKYTSSRRK